MRSAAIGMVMALVAALSVVGSAAADEAAAPSSGGGATGGTPAPPATDTLRVPEDGAVQVRFHGPGGVKFVLRSGAAPAGVAGCDSACRALIRRILAEELAARLRAPAGGPGERGRAPVSPPGAAATGTAAATGARILVPADWFDAQARLQQELLDQLARAGRSNDDLRARLALAEGGVAKAPPLPSAAPAGGVGVAPVPIPTRGGPDSAAVAPVAPPAAPPEAAAPPARQPEAAAPPAESIPQLVRRQILDTGVVETSLILFDSGRSDLLPPSHEVAVTIGNALKDQPGLKLRIEGHADRRGRAAANLRLSQERAEAVRRVLVQECGFAPDRVEAVGLGESRPLVSGSSPTRLALNRRVTFRVLDLGSLR